jgi:DNA-binding protein HU-beta
MNKAELISTVASATGVTQKETGAVLSAALEAIADAIAAGDTVTLVGFGTFKQRHRQARTGRNPRTGEEMVIPASAIPAFTPGKQFKDKVAA